VRKDFKKNMDALEMEMRYIEIPAALEKQIDDHNAPRDKSGESIAGSRKRPGDPCCCGVSDQKGRDRTNSLIYISMQVV
jgi:hypothetical protein